MRSARTIRRGVRGAHRGAVHAHAACRRYFFFFVRFFFFFASCHDGARCFFIIRLITVFNHGPSIIRQPTRRIAAEMSTANSQ